MSEQAIIGGKCPYCKSVLTTDDNDREYKIIQCPNCNTVFSLEGLLEVEHGTPLSKREESSETEEDNNYISLKYDALRYKNGGIRSYYCYITHQKLNETKKVVADTPDLLTLKIEQQVNYLENKYQQIKKIEDAKFSSINAEKDIEEHENLLNACIKKVIQVNWRDYKKEDVYGTEEPFFKIPEPSEKDALPKANFWESLFKDYKAKREEKRKIYLESLKKDWSKAKELFEKNHKKWAKEKKAFDKKQEDWNKSLDKQKELYEKGKKEGVETFYSYLLIASVYPPKFPENVILEYKDDDKTLLVEYELPDLEDMPKYKGEKYSRTTGRTEKIELSQNARDSLYDKVLYMIPIRTLYEIFRNDKFDNIESVGFNGFVNTLDKSTGKKKIVYILSLFVKKADFMELDISQIDPKACFRGLKGIASNKLSQLAPIAPIMTISREDKRFREGREVMENVDTTVNVASMDWEEFEHLVREVFSKEFGQAGMEVKVTQSSRDLGVDAVAFDPDPLRGGKIIIQAKRYTNTVKVESVRALYGIMQDEGAMKGIIVTTSDYGPDAYKFAQGKPITLINGNNLLAMLEKYGHKAKIDIKEAKKFLNEN